MASQEPNEAEVVAEVVVDGENMVIVPSSVSNERVSRIGLPSKGSEDVSHLLTAPVAAAKDRTWDEPRDYRPDDKVDWVVDVEFEGSPILQQSEIVTAFDSAWSQENGRPSSYGWSPETQHWTYLISADAPKTFTKLAFAWSLFDPVADEDNEVTALQLASYHAAVAERAARLGIATLRTNRSPQDAEKVARRIEQAIAICDRDVTVVLSAPRGRLYDGREVWDVTLCLGLAWGDMDIFHWENSSAGGDDFFFSVWTSTPPGYFFPEQIAAGRVKVRDLVFGYSIPRSADPITVFDSMMRAVHFAQKRLGGEILDANGNPLDENAVRTEVQTIVRSLEEAGFKPGQDSTLRVF